MKIQDVLADGIMLNWEGIHRYLAGFDDSNHTKTAPGLPNHVAWVLGHCAMTMHRAAERIDELPLPESDFIAGAARGDAKRFGTESVSFGSMPSEDATSFPSLARCKEIFDGAAERLAKVFRGASEEKLESQFRMWDGKDYPVWTIAVRMIGHNGLHLGQITDLRRALGMARLFG